MNILQLIAHPFATSSLVLIKSHIRYQRQWSDVREVSVVQLCAVIRILLYSSFHQLKPMIAANKVPKKTAQSRLLRHLLSKSGELNILLISASRIICNESSSVNATSEV